MNSSGGTLFASSPTSTFGRDMEQPFKFPAGAAVEAPVSSEAKRRPDTPRDGDDPLASIMSKLGLADGGSGGTVVNAPPPSLSLSLELRQ